MPKNKEKTTNKLKANKKNAASKAAANRAGSARRMERNAHSLHVGIEKTHVSAEKFHKQVDENQKDMQAATINRSQFTELTEAALKTAADEQMIELALVGRRTKKSA